jgi:hypothetical protein
MRRRIAAGSIVKSRCFIVANCSRRRRAHFYYAVRYIDAQTLRPGIWSCTEFLTSMQACVRAPMHPITYLFIIAVRSQGVRLGAAVSLNAPAADERATADRS